MNTDLIIPPMKALQEQIEQVDAALREVHPSRHSDPLFRALKQQGDVNRGFLRALTEKKPKAKSK